MANYADIWKNYFVNKNTTSNDVAKTFLGSNFDYLQNNLKNSAEGNNPLFDRLLGTAKRKIGSVTDRNIQDIKENLASSGFRGAGGNLINDAYKNESESVAGVVDNLALQEENYKQNAIAQLLGLNQFEGGQYQNLFQSDRQNMQFNQGLDEQRRQFNEQLQYQKDNTPSWWEGLLGSLLGAGGQIGAAALTGGSSAVGGAVAASDKKLKKNIKKVAETDEGIPVVKFNYKDGGKAEQIGFLSKDVKKKHPEAVREVIDYSKVPMKISKLLAA